MDFFQSLWEDPGQSQVPDGENFKLFTHNEWIKHSSTYKIITGSLQDPQEGLGINKYTNDQSSFRSDALNGRLQVIPAEKNTKAKKAKKVQQSKPKEEQNEVDVCSTTKEIKEINSEKDEMEVDSEDDDEAAVPSKYIPGRRKNPISEKLSSMDFSEHADCLRLFLKFTNSNSTAMKASDRAEHVFFEVLYKKVEEEQKLFLQDAQNQWTETAKDIRELRFSRKTPVQFIWTNKVKSALGNYPHTYIRKTMIPLFPREKCTIEMIKVLDLLQMGKIPACFTPSAKFRSRAQITTCKILSSAHHDLRPEQVVGSLHKLPVSLDPNAESLARLNKVQIVISSGALKTLLSTHFDYSKSWALPITVKEYRTIEMGKTTTKTMVFIDKPLPKPAMTVEECNHILFKYGVRSRLLQEKHINSYVFPTAGVEPLERENFSTSVQSQVDETMDVTYPSKETKQHSGEETKGSEVTHASDPPNVSADTVDEDTCNEDADDERLVIEDDISTSPSKPIDNPEEKMEVVLPKVEAPDPKSSDCPATENSSTAATQSTEMKSFQPRKDGKRLPKTDNGFTCPISSTNVTYSCWVIRPDSDKLNVHNRRVSELSVLVRCRVDGYLQGKSKEDARAVSLSAKVEHQIEFAAEEATKNELLNEWASLFFKPASFVVRTRVDLKQEELIMHERKDKVQLNADAQKLYGIRLADSLQTLYTVFSEVSTLAKGSYLLHHSGDDNTFASLEKSVDGAVGESKPIRSLREYFGKEFAVIMDANPPWPKLDRTLVLPTHEFHNVMPATYRPRPCGKAFKPFLKRAALLKQNANGLSKGFQVNKSKKKKKKKQPGRPKKKPDAEADDLK